MCYYFFLLLLWLGLVSDRKWIFFLLNLCLFSAVAVFSCFFFYLPTQCARQQAEPTLYTKIETKERVQLHLSKLCNFSSLLFQANV